MITLTVDLITRGAPHADGKILIIGGGIANFTNVAATFKGIIRALKEYKAGLIAHGVKIFVRRGGPNYQEGLKAMRLLGESLGVPIHVYGPETHITAIVPIALGVKKASDAVPKSISQTPAAPVEAKEAAQDSDDSVQLVYVGCPPAPSDADIGCRPHKIRPNKLTSKVAKDSK